MAAQVLQENKLGRYLQKYKKTAPYSLSASDTESLTLKEVVAMCDEETKSLWSELNLGYSEMNGNALLREEIANMHGVTKEDVLVVVSQEGIYIAMNCLMQYLQSQSGAKPFHAVAIYPAYPSLLGVLNTYNCKLDYWEAQHEATGWNFDLNNLRKMITTDTKLLVVNFPHNPTGYLPYEEEWNELIELCRERNIFLFSDEIYSFTNNDDTKANRSACSLYDNSISLFGMSKTLALPGLRMGWLCTKNVNIYNMMSNFNDYLTICPPSPSQILSLIALRNRDEILQRTMGIVHANLKSLEKFFAKDQEVFDWHPPRAGTATFVKVKGWLLKIGEGGASGFSDALAKEKGVLMLPASVYDYTDEYVRLGFCRKNLPECLLRLDEFLNDYKKQQLVKK